MKATALLLIVCVRLVQCHFFPAIEATVKGSATLPCNCSGGTIEWSILYPTKDSIATCQDGKKEITQTFQDRVSISCNTSTEDFSLSFSPLFYNDDAIYICKCNGVAVSEGKLKIYCPEIMEVFEGENVTLPCYGDTRRNANNAQWKKDGHILLTLSKSEGDAEAGRFAMSKEGFQTGDLSLLIHSVQQSDTGFYRCLMQDESRDGDPRAVQLIVKQHQPKQQPADWPPTARFPTFGVILLLVLLIIPAAIYCKRRRNQPRDQSSAKISVQEEHQMIPKVSSTQPIQD